MSELALKRVTVTRLCILLLVGSSCYAQSLGDAARENRKQKPDKGSAATKVISGDDLVDAPEVIQLLPGSTATGQGTVVTPGRGKHNYPIVMLDASRFVNGGTIRITITAGSGESEASFDLYPQGLPLPEEGLPNSLAGAHNVRRTSGAQITYHFAHGGVFQFAAEGSWNSKPGATNTYSFAVDVDGQSTH